jgi:DNA-directed RNA polymerase III subunit RPC4
MDVDPNDSPASQPTETPAPTPIRPTPVITPTEPIVKVKKESRFKPKAVRTSQAKLAEVEAAEREKQKKLDEAYDKAQRLAGRGNALRGRGRGDAMGRGRSMASKGATGAFGGAWESGKFYCSF